MRLSYRESLAKIGIAPQAVVSYQRDFASRPRTLAQAIASMDAPASAQWTQVAEIFRDDDWTDEVQGVAWDGRHWIFSANANQDKPGVEDKALYVFNSGEGLGDGKWVSRLKYKDVPHPIAGTSESNDHWGQLCHHEGSIYVAHFWEDVAATDAANVVVFDNSDGVLTYSRWIELEKPTSPTDKRHARAEFQALNPWDGMLYTCFGDGFIHEFFIHDPSTGKWTERTLKLDPPLAAVQGACFSPNGHLYIATNALLVDDKARQLIFYRSALNGHLFGVISVLAEAGLPDQELEGLCYASVTTADGQAAQIHAVLLENRDVALDNIFFKSFGSGSAQTV